MNRKILFRGKTLKPVTLNKHIVAEVGQWIYGGIVEHIGGTYILMPDSGYGYISIEVIPETVSQYTGLEDKNGKKIFDGDIVQWSNIKMEIFWGEHIGIGYGFCWRPYGEEQSYHESMTGFIDEYEVIGNIFDEKE